MKSCDVPSCIYVAAIGYVGLCAAHGFAWYATQELRDDQIIGPGFELRDGEPALVLVGLQTELVRLRLEVASVERLLV